MKIDEFLQKQHWPHHLLRWLVLNCIAIFYRRVAVKGADLLPLDKSALFIANHPNGLIDPLLMMVGLKRPLAFLAKSTLYGNPIGKFIMNAFGALPVFRKQDEGLPGGAQGEVTEANEASFAICRRRLHAKEAIALFPEGTTHSHSQLLKLRTGAARIALSTEAENDWQTGLQVVPVGLWYENKALFRTEVLVVVGEPFDLQPYQTMYMEDTHQAVNALTERMEAALNQVVLQAENDELLAGIPYIAAWTGEKLSMAEQHAWTAKLLDAYTELHRTNPAQLEQFANEARQYANTLFSLGIQEPWALERPIANHRRLIMLTCGLIVTFPLMLIGLLMSYIPYRLATPLASTLVGDDYTQTSTVKFVGGSLMVLCTWIIEAMLVGWLLGFWWGVIIFLAAPPLAYLTLRWSEGWRELRQLLTCRWIRWRREDLVSSLIEQRQHLQEQVLTVVK